MNASENDRMIDNDTGTAMDHVVMETEEMDLRGPSELCVRFHIVGCLYYDAVGPGRSPSRCHHRNSYTARSKTFMT